MSNLWVTTSTWTAAVSRFTTKGLWLSMPVLIAVVRAVITVPTTKNYFKRTIAHNSLLVYDPDEKFGCWNYGGGGKTRFATNDGGQRMCGEGWKTCNSLDSLLSEEYTVGKVLAHGFGPDAQAPDYSYLKGI